MSTPRSLEEWAAHVAGLDGAALRSKARAANSIDFVEDLRAEGYGPDEIETLFILIAQQLERTGQMLPSEGLYSYPRLARRPLPVALPKR